METKTIINLLNDLSNEESELATIKWHVIVKLQKTNSSKTILSNSRQKLLTQVFAIILMHVF